MENERVNVGQAGVSVPYQIEPEVEEAVREIIKRRDDPNRIVHVEAVYSVEDLGYRLADGLIFLGVIGEEEVQTDYGSNGTACGKLVVRRNRFLVGRPLFHHVLSYQKEIRELKDKISTLETTIQRKDEVVRTINSRHEEELRGLGYLKLNNETLKKQNDEADSRIGKLSNELQAVKESAIQMMIRLPSALKTIVKLPNGTEATLQELIESDRVSEVLMGVQT